MTRYGLGARLGGLFVMGSMGAPIAPLCMRAIGLAAREKAPAVDVANVAVAGAVVVSSAADADEPSAGRPPPDDRAPPAEATSMSKIPEVADADRLKPEPDVACGCCFCCCCCCC